MSWLNKQVSIYECAADNTGRPATFQQVLLSQFGVDHKYYFKTYPENKDIFPKGKWISGVSNDFDTMLEIRHGGLDKKDQVLLKQTMQCFTPACLLKSKKQGAIEEIERTGLLQLDFDYNDIKEYDIEELKRAVFSLPFVAFCGLSCSGAGFYSLVSIAEPHRLNEYAEHCFDVLLREGIKADTTKGKNVNDLRFVSYDPNMLIRDEPTPLKIRRFNPKPKPKPPVPASFTQTGTNRALVNKQLTLIDQACIGTRWGIIQKVAYTLGGLQDSSILTDIENTIRNSSNFTGEEEKYIECARVCFASGMATPLQSSAHLDFADNN